MNCLKNCKKKNEIFLVNDGYLYNNKYLTAHDAKTENIITGI